jgi:hypothetical protein
MTLLTNGGSAMQKGNPINRQWIVVLRNGSIIIDWGDGRAQDIHTGEFLRFDGEYSHGITDQELEVLINAGRVFEYDRKDVYIAALPDPPRDTIE